MVSTTESWEFLCTKTISNCLLELISHTDLNISTDTVDIINETVLDHSTDGILCENTSFGCSNNKKRKLEIDWSWQLVIQEIKSNKDDHTQYTWSLILEQLIKNNWTQIPKTYLLLIVDHVVRKLHEIETNDFQNRKSSNIQSKKIDLVSLKAIFFNMFYLILKNASLYSSQDANVMLKISKETVSKTIDHFYKQLNVNQTNYFTILIDFVSFSSLFKLETNYFKLIIEKFLSLLTTTSAFEIEPQFLKLISAIVLNNDLNKIVQESSAMLIEGLLANLKAFNMNQSIVEHTETENIENISFTAAKSNKRMTQSFFEPKLTKPIVKSKNFNQNFILISDILLGLTGIRYERNMKKREENIEIILELTSHLETTKQDTTVEEIDMYYANLTEIKMAEKKTSQNQLTGLINMKAYKSIFDKLLERSKQLCQSVDFSLQSEINDSEMNKTLLDEFFLQLDYCSALMTYAAKSQTILDLSMLIKQIKSVSCLISMNCKKLLKNILQQETPANENKNAISQLEFILTEILFNFSTHICCNETQLHLFLYSLDPKLLELLLQFLSLSDTDLVIENFNELNEVSSDISRTNEYLKKILRNASLSLAQLDKSMSELGRIKLISLAFLSSLSVEYTYLNEISKKMPLNTKELNVIGRNLKKNLLSICSSFFEKSYDQKSKTELLVCKEDMLSSKSMNKLFSLILILNSLKRRNSAGIDWTEFKLILGILKSLVINEYFNCCRDPVLNRIVLKLIGAYASKLLMVNSFLSWFEANLNNLMPNLNAQNLNSLKSAYTCLEAIQDEYIEIVNCIQLIFIL